MSLQLVLLKLRQSLNFGDAIINGCTNIFEESQFKDTIENMTLDDINIKDPYAISKFIYQTGLNIDQNFFNILRDYKISSKYFLQNLSIFSVGNLLFFINYLRFVFG